MSNEEINELFYTLQQEIASRASQIAPTWEDIVTRQAQNSTSQQAYNFEGGNHFNNNASSSPNPTTTWQATISQVGGHMKISPMAIQLCKAKEVKAPIIISNSGNHLIKSYSLH